MNSYEEYKQKLQIIADLKNSLAVLQWDQEIYLPSKGARFRARQIATLSEQIHLLSTEEKLGNLLEELAARQDVPFLEKKNVELSLEDYRKTKKYSAEFVRKLSETVSKCFHSWMDARKENAYAVFEPDLQLLIELKKQEADILGYESHPYNALLNEHEKGCTISLLNKTFLELSAPLKELLNRIVNSRQVDDHFLYQNYPKQQQWDYGMKLIGRLGFDFEAGRQDISEHPFTTSFNRNDVRITTRINENNFATMTWSCIHEAGHALYEQGLPENEYGLPSGEFASLGIHESQSRLWENNIGRSLDFWSFSFPELQAFFPQQLARQTAGDFYKGINKVQPSLIRTEADELTYHFHVMVRYDLEKLLLENGLTSHDIPAYWNEHYEKYLGLKVPDDKQGCLQDVHWSHGSFGYFPTYSLGSFYAAQFYHAAEKQMPQLRQSIIKGNAAPLLGWLREHIHQHGRLYTSEELCLRACGEPLNTRYFLDYALDKYKNIYDL